MDEYAHITPEHLAALSLCRAAHALEQAGSDATNWFFVILDLHRALYCGLVAALAGPAGIGAYPKELRIKWLEYFEASRNDLKAEPPTENYVLRFQELLSMAQEGTSDIQQPLKLTAEQRADILKLNQFRADLEHVKPRLWSLGIGGLPRMCASAATAFAGLLDSFVYRLDAELEQVKAAVSKFEQLATKYPSCTPSSWY